jgi:AraC-like DNA-binding protein
LELAALATGKILRRRQPSQFQNRLQDRIWGVAEDFCRFLKDRPFFIRISTRQHSSGTIMARKGTYSIEKWQGMARDSSYRAARLSKILGVSRRRLERLTQRLFRRSPQAWLSEQRMIVAARFLKEGRPIKTVAFDLGFKQRSHFARQFRIYYGLPPKQYVVSLGRPPREGCENKPEGQIAASATGQG